MYSSSRERGRPFKRPNQPRGQKKKFKRTEKVYHYHTTTTTTATTTTAAQAATATATPVHDATVISTWDLKQIATAGATTVTVTEEVWGEQVKAKRTTK